MFFGLKISLKINRIYINSLKFILILYFTLDTLQHKFFLSIVKSIKSDVFQTNMWFKAAYQMEGAMKLIALLLITLNFSINAKVDYSGLDFEKQVEFTCNQAFEFDELLLFGHFMILLANKFYFI